MYTTTPVGGEITHSTPSYEPIFVDALHMDLKRQILQAPSNETVDRRSQSLFDRYQFFTPGEFWNMS